MMLLAAKIKKMLAVPRSDQATKTKLFELMQRRLKHYISGWNWIIQKVMPFIIYLQAPPD